MTAANVVRSDLRSGSINRVIIQGTSIGILTAYNENVNLLQLGVTSVQTHRPAPFAANLRMMIDLSLYPAHISRSCDRLGFARNSGL